MLKSVFPGSNGKDILIAGVTSTIRQFLQAGHIDEMLLAFAPVFLGSGEHVCAGIDLRSLGFTEIQTIQGNGASHKKSK